MCDINMFSSKLLLLTKTTSRQGEKAGNRAIKTVIQKLTLASGSSLDKGKLIYFNLPLFFFSTLYLLYPVCLSVIFFFKKLHCSYKFHNILLNIYGIFLYTFA